LHTRVPIDRPQKLPFCQKKRQPTSQKLSTFRGKQHRRFAPDSLISGQTRRLNADRWKRCSLNNKLNTRAYKQKHMFPINKKHNLKLLSTEARRQCEAGRLFRTRTSALNKQKRYAIDKLVISLAL
jgi:hypothetical protein